MDPADVFTSTLLPPDCPSRRAFARACKRIPGAALRGKCWVVSKSAWNKSRTMRTTQRGAS